MKKAYKIAIAFIFGLNLVSLACSPLQVPILLSSNVTATNLSLNWQSVTQYLCGNAIDVEIACSTAPFSGLGVYTYTSAAVVLPSNPYNYPTQNINISNLCPGAVYKYRARQRNSPGSATSGWTATYTFTMPGVFVPPTSNITATPPIITTCPQGNSILAFNCINCCGNPPYNYTWTPAASLSCSTCASPVATPVVTTIYTVNTTGGQLGCWAMTNTVQVTVISTPPSVGTASINPPIMCAGKTATVSISSFSGAIQWQSAPVSAGPWTNVAGATTGSFITAPLNSSTCYHAIVTGCGGTLTSNAVCVTVNPTPTITVNSMSMCAGSTASLIANGATSYTWSAGTTTTGVNTANASPLVNTSYTVIGSTSGCTNSAVSNITVNPLPVPTATNNGPLCTGSNLNLSSSGGGTYQWSGPLSFSSVLQNPTIISTNTAQAGVYSLTVTLNGCTSNTTTSVTITTPTASASNTGPYCAGATIQLNTPAATSYTWSGPNAFTSNLQNPTIAASTVGMSGTYTVVTTIGSCTTLATTSITVNALPTPTISNNGPICNGQTLNLNSGGAVTYTWSGPSAFSSLNQNPSIPSAIPANSGVYTVAVTNVNGCINSTTTNVTVNPTPTITTVGSTVCAAQSMSLSANSFAGSAYLWTGPNSFVSNSQNPVTANAQVSMSGVYNLTVASVAGCTNTASANVFVIALPTPTIVSNTPCAGATLTLGVIGTTGASFSWNGPNGFSSIIQGPNINNVTVSASGMYTVVATAGICSVAVTQSVTVNPLPNPTAINNAPICETKDILLTGSGGVTYSWTGPSNFVSSVSSPSIAGAISSQSGNYILTVTDVNGCQATVTTSVTILANPYVLANGAMVCYGFSATLTATGGVSYAWSGPNGFSSNIANPTVPIINNNTMGTYNVIVTSANSCTSASAVNVSTYPLPVPTITATSKTCINTQVVLQGGPGFLMYQWKGPDNFLSPNTVVTFTPTSMTQSGVYTLSVVDNRGCVGSLTTLVMLDPLPNATVLIDKNKLCIPFCSNFSLQNASGAAPLVSSSWYFNGQTFNGSTLNYCITNSGDYLIKANFTDANGCPNSSTYTLNAYPIPTAMFEYSPAKPIEVVDEVKFTDGSKGPGINNWNWHFISNTGYQTGMQNPSYTFEKAGSYAIALIVTNKWGCSDTTVKSITIGEGNAFYVPNTFTPNGDGINDTFYATGYNISKYEMTVFDRWGEKLFHTTDLSSGWDGTFKGAESKNDIYVWKISVTLPDSKVKVYTGHITLNR